MLSTIERIINKSMPIIDRYGYKSYLREDRGVFYFDRAYPSDTNPTSLMSYYSGNLIAVSGMSLSNVLSTIDTHDYDALFNYLESNISTCNLEDIYNRLLIKGNVYLFEKAIVHYFLDLETPLVTWLMNRNKFMTFYLNEPITELRKVHIDLSTTKVKRGRTSNPDIKKSLKRVNVGTFDSSNLVFEENTDLVCLHTLYSQVVGRTEYATTSKFTKGEGRTRILKPSELSEGFRDLTQHELLVYNTFIQIFISQELERYNQFGIYGFTLKGKFRIVDKYAESEMAFRDSRLRRSGRLCNTMKIPMIIEKMWRIRMFPKDFTPYPEEQREELAYFALNNEFGPDLLTCMNFSIEQLSFYHYCSQIKRNRDQWCEAIKEYMFENGLCFSGIQVP